MIKELLKRLFCVHHFKVVGIEEKTMHSQMVCEKCGKKKYNFEM